MTKLGCKWDFYLPVRGFERDLESEAWIEMSYWKNSRSGQTDFVLTEPTREAPESIAARGLG